MQNSILVFCRDQQQAGLIARTLRYREYSCLPVSFEMTAAQAKERKPKGIIVAGNRAEALEGLEGKIEGLVSMTILTEPFACSAGDLMMDSTFESAEALAAYQKHPLHVAVADGLVRPSVCQRLSFDYQE